MIFPCRRRCRGRHSFAAGCRLLILRAIVGERARRRQTRLRQPVSRITTGRAPRRFTIIWKLTVFGPQVRIFPGGAAVSAPVWRTYARARDEPGKRPETNNNELTHLERGARKYRISDVCRRQRGRPSGVSRRVDPGGDRRRHARRHDPRRAGDLPGRSLQPLRPPDHHGQPAIDRQGQEGPGRRRQGPHHPERRPGDGRLCGPGRLRLRRQG